MHFGKFGRGLNFFIRGILVGSDASRIATGALPPTISSLMRKMTMVMVMIIIMVIVIIVVMMIIMDVVVLAVFRRVLL